MLAKNNSPRPFHAAPPVSRYEPGQEQARLELLERRLPGVWTRSLLGDSADFKGMPDRLDELVDLLWSAFAPADECMRLHRPIPSLLALGVPFEGRPWHPSFLRNCRAVRRRLDAHPTTVTALDSLPRPSFPATPAGVVYDWLPTDRSPITALATLKCIDEAVAGLEQLTDTVESCRTEKKLLTESKRLLLEAEERVVAALRWATALCLQQGDTIGALRRGEQAAALETNLDTRRAIVRAMSGGGRASAASRAVRGGRKRSV